MIRNDKPAAGCTRLAFLALFLAALLLPLRAAPPAQAAPAAPSQAFDITNGLVGY